MRPKIIEVVARYDLSFEPTQAGDVSMIIDTRVRLVSRSAESVVIEAQREVLFDPAGPFKIEVTARVEVTTVKKKKLTRGDVSEMAAPALAKISLVLSQLSEQLTGGIPLITPPHASADEVKWLPEEEPEGVTRS